VTCFANQAEGGQLIREEKSLTFTIIPVLIRVAYSVVLGTEIEPLRVRCGLDSILAVRLCNSTLSKLRFGKISV
jgi:hypothetical protein